MSEPLEEGAEESWITHLNRFDTEIYPVLFQARGYTKAEALMIWQLSRIESSVDLLLAQKEL